MMPAVKAVIALGSNLEDPEAQVLQGFAEIAALPDTLVSARSSLHRTAPVGYADQPDFVNACALVETRLAPRALLEALLEIEKKHGRVREIPNGPRTLDLDIVVYGGAVIDEPGLKVPHPRAHQRAFVLEPLLEVWPDAVIPERGRAADLVRQFVVPAKAGTQPLDSRLRGNDEGVRGSDER